MKRSKLEVGLIVLVSSVWTISTLSDLLLSDWEPSPFIHFAMMGVLGAIFGKQYFNSGNGETK